MWGHKSTLGTSKLPILVCPPRLVQVQDAEYLITGIMIPASPGRSSAVLYGESLIVRTRKMPSRCAGGQEAARDSASLRLKLSPSPLSFWGPRSGLWFVMRLPATRR